LLYIAVIFSLQNFS